MPINSPDRMIMSVPGLDWRWARAASTVAVQAAQREAPKLTGDSAKSIQAIYSSGEFGLRWTTEYLYIQNAGARAFTMRKLAGKTIPMWIDDPTGEEQRKNPKAKTRITVSGKMQILIFRKAAPIGSRKTVKRKVSGGVTIEKSVPRSYPGAPGRIALREAYAPFTDNGKISGAIAKGNAGVRWYFPGLTPRHFLENALHEAASYYQLQGTIRIGYGQGIRR
jgi:hypothetical protein